MRIDKLEIVKQENKSDKVMVTLFRITTRYPQKVRYHAAIHREDLTVRDFENYTPKYSTEYNWFQFSTMAQAEKRYEALLSTEVKIEIPA